MKKRSPKREYKDYVVDIADAIESIEEFVKGFDFTSFRADQKTIFAVVRAFEIIGEAVSKIPASIKTKHKKIPWRDVADMRNKLIHEYFGVNKEVVWNTIHKDIPALKETISEILSELRIRKLL